MASEIKPLILRFIAGPDEECYVVALATALGMSRWSDVLDYPESERDGVWVVYFIPPSDGESALIRAKSQEEAIHSAAIGEGGLADPDPEEWEYKENCDRLTARRMTPERFQDRLMEDFREEAKKMLKSEERGSSDKRGPIFADSGESDRQWRNE